MNTRHASLETETLDGHAVAVSRFEFWPPWLFYPPVVVYCLGLALRHRGLTLPTVANPSIEGGGLISESKSAILDLVGGEQRKWVAAYTTVDKHRTDTPNALLARARDALRQAGIDYPIVAKPDLGQRGAGVWPIDDDDRLHAYLGLFPKGHRIVLQRRITDPGEAGVFYVRRPGDDHGEIFSITLKYFPAVIGDGRRTLREHVLGDPRARRLAKVYLRRHVAHANRVLAVGERFPLVFSGNHCQGTIFKDGTRHATPALLARFEAIARAIPEFYFGRFDLRYRDLEALRRGEGFRIVEINAAGAEATHIWDGGMSLREAYRTLFAQFRLLYEIGAANRERGYRAASFIRLAREFLSYLALAKRYPTTQ